MKELLGGGKPHVHNKKGRRSIPVSQSSQLVIRAEGGRVM